MDLHHAYCNWFHIILAIVHIIPVQKTLMGQPKQEHHFDASMAALGNL
jgi:hypothetical protein